MEIFIIKTVLNVIKLVKLAKALITMIAYHAILHIIFKLLLIHVFRAFKNIMEV